MACSGAALAMLMWTGNAMAQLVGGNGWSGNTAQPSPVGNSSMPGYTAKCIARWDVVPYQTVSTTLNIGVVAFHINGIDRVEFAADAGPWVSVTAERINPQTGVSEYWVSLNPAQFNDGPVEVRARIYPRTAGIPRVLQGEIDPLSTTLGEHSLYLSTNADNSLQSPERYVSPTGNDITGTGTSNQPFRTIGRAALDLQLDYGDAEGASILLKPGSYTFGPVDNPPPITNDRWLTVKPAPGADRAQVKITDDGGGVRTRLLCLQNVTIDQTPINNSVSLDGLLWTDRCDIDSGSRTSGVIILNDSIWRGGLFITDSIIRRAMYAAVDTTFVRNTEVYDIGADAFKNPRFIVNCTVRDIDNTGIQAHPDVLQFYGSDFDNVIVYGLRAVEDIDAQGFFSRRNQNDDGWFTDSAFVNVLLRSDRAGQWQQNADHVLLWHFSYIGNKLWIRDDSAVAQNGFTTRLKDFSLLNSVLDRVVYEVSFGPPHTQIARDLHIIDGDTFGTDCTTGDPRFVNEAQYDYHPAAISPLNDRVNPLAVRYDLELTPVGLPGSIGPLQEPGGSGGGGGGGGGGGTGDATLDNFSFIHGTHIGGTLDDLATSNNVRLKGRSRPGFSSNNSQMLEIELTGTSPDRTPTALDITIESKLTTAGGTARVRMRNWDTGSYELVHSYPIGLSESAVAFTDEDAEDHVKGFNGKFIMRIRHTVVANFGVPQFDSYFDWMKITPR